jgi:hypothetical protein
VKLTDERTKSGELQEKYAGIFLKIFFLMSALWLVYLFFGAKDVSPAKIVADSYQGSAGCPKQRGIKVTLENNDCFSSRNIIRDWRKRNLTLSSWGRPDFSNYYRIDNDAVLISCYTTILMEQNCYISKTEKDIFVEKIR